MKRALLGVLPLLLLTACGSDDPVDPAPAPAPVSGSTDDTDPGLDQFNEVLGEEGLANALGEGLVYALEAATAYTYADGVLELTMTGSNSESVMHCIVAKGAGDLAESGTTLRLVYPDGTIDCN
ncbi:hypothetical protein [Nocardioides limicola]|uniref:hypothetical protein n=1 Tax=Nocardioides limicola TaxID=2803368 RepID=UPI00193C751E|nr:hypothetical protein [Nocardioides sp. DJM-14]